MNLVFMGPAGSGKGVCAQRIGPLFEIPQVATGDLFREEMAKKSPIGIEAEKYISKGMLVPDGITFEILKARLAKPDAAKGFILDGFPRNLQQAMDLDKMIKIDAVVYLNVPEDILVTRLSSRVTCKKCLKIYNLLFLKPKVAGICDVCGGELYSRADDVPETIRARLHEQWKLTEKVVDYFRKRGILKEVAIDETEANRPPESNANKILEALGRKERLAVK